MINEDRRLALLNSIQLILLGRFGGKTTITTTTLAGDTL